MNYNGAPTSFAPAFLSVGVRSLRRAKRIVRSGPKGDGISDERRTQLRRLSRPGSERQRRCQARFPLRYWPHCSMTSARASRRSERW